MGARGGSVQAGAPMVAPLERILPSEAQASVRAASVNVRSDASDVSDVSDPESVSDPGSLNGRSAWIVTAALAAAVNVEPPEIMSSSAVAVVAIASRNDPSLHRTNLAAGTAGHRITAQSTAIDHPTTVAGESTAKASMAHAKRPHHACADRSKIVADMSKKAAHTATEATMADLHTAQGARARRLEASITHTLLTIGTAIVSATTDGYSSDSDQ
jgi:hypothetical protein